jgi:hypothetical protein
MDSYSINRANVTDVVERLVNDNVDLRSDVEGLITVVETLVVAFKKQLGKDAEDLLVLLDEIAGRERMNFDTTGLKQHETNEIGAVFSDKRDSARVD